MKFIINYNGEDKKVKTNWNLKEFEDNLKKYDILLIGNKVYETKLIKDIREEK